MRRAAQCRPLPLLELVNELDANTNEPDPLGRVFDLSLHAQAPAPLLSSHGSNGSQAIAVRPAWSYETFHTNDAPEWHRKTGHNAMELSDGTDGLAASRVPILTNENTRFSDRCQSAQMAFDAAAGAALLCAGSCYHSIAGKKSALWDGVELECARAWASGARSVPLEFQDGRYAHAADLEGPARTPRLQTDSVGRTRRPGQDSQVRPEAPVSASPASSRAAANPRWPRRLTAAPRTRTSHGAARHRSPTSLEWSGDALPAAPA